MESQSRKGVPSVDEFPDCFWGAVLLPLLCTWTNSRFGLGSTMALILESSFRSDGSRRVYSWSICPWSHPKGALSSTHERSPWDTGAARHPQMGYQEALPKAHVGIHSA